MPINPADQLGEPDYRYYNCNLQAPNMKCGTLTADTVQSGALAPSGLCVDNGFKAMASVHTFTSVDIPCLDMATASGELTIYFKNQLLQVANVTLAVLIKTGGSLNSTSSMWYQRIGNMTSVELTVSGSTATFTVDPQVECRWVWRGF